MPANADLIFTNADGSSNRVALTLEANGWSEEFVSPTPVPDAIDDTNYESQNPDFGRVFDQSTWHRGFGEAICRNTHNCDRYGYTEGILAMFEGELVPSYQEDEVDILVQNGRFEAGATTGWAGSNATLAISTNPHGGVYSMQVTADANNAQANESYGGTVSVLRSREVTLLAFARRISGSGTIKAVVADSAGSDDSSTSSSSDWTLLEVTRTIDAGATTLTWRLELSTNGDVFEVDDVAVIPTGGTNFPTRPIEFEGGFYVCCGRLILKWNEADDCWYAVEADDGTTSFTSIESFEGSLYAGRGSSDNYRTSSDGATWADPSTNTGNNRLAVFFARVMNANGDWALMKTRANQVSLTTAPSDTANWGAEIQVGDSDRAITNLIAANNTGYVGREDGPFVYDRTINRFRDIEPDLNFFPSASNFKTMLGRGGSVWASGGQQTFWRITPADSGGVAHAWQDLTGLFAAPAFRGFGGAVDASAQDRTSVWLALADNAASNLSSFPYTFPFNFSTSGISDIVRLMVVKEIQDSATGEVRPIAHTVTSFTVTAIDQLGRFFDGSTSSLFAFGSFADTTISAGDKDIPRVIRLRMPVTNENPRHASNIQVRRSGNYFSPWIDFNFPDVEKAISKLTINSRNFSTGAKFVTVYYKLDDASDDDGTGWTPWGDDGVFDTSPSETKSSVTSTPVTFKRIRFRISWTSDSNSAEPPTVTGIVMHVVWNPSDYRKFRAVARLTDRRSLQMRRARTRVLRTADMSNLNTLRAEPFVQVTTPFGDTYLATIHYSRNITGRRVLPRSGVPADVSEVVEITGTEVRTG